MPVATPVAKARPVIGLVLGGGAAKGFAHIGVIKALEAQGIKPDLVIGTSAGSLIGALYAAGKSGFELQALAIPLNEFQVSDWVLPDRGMIKGEALARFVNTAVGNRPLEKLPRKFGVVATDLASGEPIVFRSGDTGTAVRASSSVPGVFQPVSIRGHEYVDGGLSSPVPVRFAREMGATFVIAVDISDKPLNSKLKQHLRHPDAIGHHHGPDHRALRAAAGRRGDPARHRATGGRLTSRPAISRCWRVRRRSPGSCPRSRQTGAFRRPEPH